jgi:hypothetical protein
MPTNIWSWAVTKWKFVTTSSTMWTTMRVAKCDPIAQTAWKGWNPSFNPHWRAHID